MLFDDFKKGQSVLITDPISPYYGKIGKVERNGKTGGLYIKHTDGCTVYHPWGFERVLPR